MNEEDMAVVDSDGERWVSIAQVVAMWNERMRDEGKPQTYTRWHVAQRKKLARLDSPYYGVLIKESEARNAKLRPHDKARPDVTERNHARATRDESVM